MMALPRTPVVVAVAMVAAVLASLLPGSGGQGCDSALSLVGTDYAEARLLISVNGSDCTTTMVTVDFSVTEGSSPTLLAVDSLSFQPTGQETTTLTLACQPSPGGTVLRRLTPSRALAQYQLQHLQTGITTVHTLQRHPEPLTATFTNGILDVTMAVLPNCMQRSVIEVTAAGTLIKETFTVRVSSSRSLRLPATLSSAFEGILRRSVTISLFPDSDRVELASTTIVLTPCTAGNFWECRATTQCRCPPVQTCLPGSAETAAPSETSDRVCNSCAVGFFSDEQNQVMCKPCAPGTFQNEDGQPGCKTVSNCLAGSIEGAVPTPSSDRVCEPCPAGEFQDETNKGSCKVCPAGTFQDARAQADCKNCRPGTASAKKGLTARSCPLCPFETFQDEEGEKACDACPLNEKISGADFCIVDCGPTQFFEILGSQQCVPLTVCSSVQFEKEPPTVSRDRVCAPVGTCDVGTFEAMPPTATSARLCSTCTPVCPPGFQQVVPCTPSVDLLCQDREPPVITLSPPSTLVILERGSIFTPPRATASDSAQSSGRLRVAVSGTVNQDVAGEYSMSYSATDDAGNTGQAVLVVVVVDRRPPTLSLRPMVLPDGSTPFNPTLPFGVPFAEPGADGVDLPGENLTDFIVVPPMPRLHQYQPAVYRLAYTLQDADGNEAGEVRNVTVSPLGAPPAPASRLNLTVRGGLDSGEPAQQFAADLGDALGVYVVVLALHAAPPTETVVTVAARDRVQWEFLPGAQLEARFGAAERRVGPLVAVPTAEASPSTGSGGGAGGALYIAVGVLAGLVVLVLVLALVRRAKGSSKVRAQMGSDGLDDAAARRVEMYSNPLFTQQGGTAPNPRAFDVDVIVADKGAIIQSADLIADHVPNVLYHTEQAPEEQPEYAVPGHAPRADKGAPLHYNSTLTATPLSPVAEAAELEPGAGSDEAGGGVDEAEARALADSAVLVPSPLYTTPSLRPEEAAGFGDAGGEDNASTDEAAPGPEDGAVVVSAPLYTTLAPRPEEPSSKKESAEEHDAAGVGVEEAAVMAAPLYTVPTARPEEPGSSNKGAAGPDAAWNAGADRGPTGAAPAAVSNAVVTLPDYVNLGAAPAVAALGALAAESSTDGPAPAPAGPGAEQRSSPGPVHLSLAEEVDALAAGQGAGSPGLLLQPAKRASDVNGFVRFSVERGTMPSARRQAGAQPAASATRPLQRVPSGKVILSGAPAEPPETVVDAPGIQQQTGAVAAPTALPGSPAQAGRRGRPQSAVPRSPQARHHGSPRPASAHAAVAAGSPAHAGSPSTDRASSSALSASTPPSWLLATRCSRQESDRLLRTGETYDGKFLVRESVSQPGAFALCVIWRSKVGHHLLAKVDGCFALDGLAIPGTTTVEQAVAQLLSQGSPKLPPSGLALH